MFPPRLGGSSSSVDYFLRRLVVCPNAATVSGELPRWFIQTDARAETRQKHVKNTLGADLTWVSTPIGFRPIFFIAKFFFRQLNGLFTAINTQQGPRGPFLS